MSDDWGLNAIIQGRTVTESWQRGLSVLAIDEYRMLEDTTVNDLHDLISCEPIRVQVVKPDERSPEHISNAGSSSFQFSDICSSSAVGDIKETVYNKSKKSAPNAVNLVHVHKLTSGATRRKSRKQSTVVQQAAKADGLVLDKWNWRKYGQKTIKGSPYPRSYYRCSSSSDCRARRQVERNIDDPNTYTISYIADHCHPYPTRRYTQAGRTLTRFSSPTSAKLQKVIDLPTTARNDHGSRSENAASNSHHHEANNNEDFFHLTERSYVDEKAAIGIVNPIQFRDETVAGNHHLGIELEHVCGLDMQDYYYLNSWNDDLWSFDPFLVDYSDMVL